MSACAQSLALGQARAHQLFHLLPAAGQPALAHLHDLVLLDPHPGHDVHGLPGARRPRYTAACCAIGSSAVTIERELSVVRAN